MDVCIILIILVLLAIALLSLHVYVKYSSVRYNNSYTCLVGKTVIVTGANAGIGYHTALDFATRGARVILACRNIAKAEETRRKIVDQTDNEEIVVKIVDFQSFASIRRFAKTINETEERLDILVNNVGAFGLGNELTEDGLLPTYQVNYFSVFLLIHLLLGKLKANKSTRIVNVASIVACLTKVHPENLNVYPGIKIRVFRDFFAYARSKLYMVIFTTELARRLQGTGVTANVLHPGLISTKIWSDNVPRFVALLLYIPLLYFWSPEQGAQTTIYVSVSKDVENSSGKLYHNCRETSVYRNAGGGELAAKIWTKTEELVKINETEKIVS